MSNRSIMADFVKVKPGKDQPTGAEIFDKAISLGLPECVAREWVHEISRRATMELRREQRKARKGGSIVRVITGKTHVLFLHATKGWKRQSRRYA